ncbi:MAG: ATP-binding cassette domain-containing protein [Treponema sp.]|nr:ATP-binding cassette domain-containing protein [Treponema sp.]
MVLEAKNIFFKYKGKSDYIINDFSISIESNEVVGLIGPSGYGKSTIGKILAGQEKAEKGCVLLDENRLPKKGYSPVQLIYQHPELAVNPKWKMRRTLEEVGEVDMELCTQLGIKEMFLDRWPQELSGGELQRFNVYRALRPETKFIVADEISTMLDVITQAQIWKVILSYARKFEIGILAITHNQNLADAVCTRQVFVGDMK